MQQNRFKAFSDSENEQSDDEVQHSQKQNRPVDPRSRADKRNDKKNDDKKNESTYNEPSKVLNDGKKQKAPKEQQKEKGVSANPHPQDKQSGQAFKSHERKGGQGKGNWGTFKDDLKELPKDAQDAEVVAVKEQPVEEEQLTLQEYLAKSGIKQSNTVQQQKGDQDYTSFLKEGCQVIEQTLEVNDKNPTKKKQINDKYIGMQNTELLGFRTGIKTYALREERPEGERRERNERPQRQNKEETTTQKVEVEQQQTEGTVQENKPAEQKQDQEKKPYRNNRDGDRQNYGGERQNRGGGYKGGEKRGNRQQGAQKANVNLEDDSLFPKLG